VLIPCSFVDVNGQRSFGQRKSLGMVHIKSAGSPLPQPSSLRKPCHPTTSTVLNRLRCPILLLNSYVLCFSGVLAQALSRKRSRPDDSDSDDASVVSIHTEDEPKSRRTQIIEYVID
jgi:hypothetical protein